MKVKMFWFVIVLIYLALAGCTSDNTLGPQFEPEITNDTDSFEFQATQIVDVTQSLQYTWQNTGTMANINQASSITAGSATLTIRDADGAEVYQKDLSENGTFISAAGAAGAWTILVNLSGCDGTLNFRAEKRTP